MPTPERRAETALTQLQSLSANNQTLDTLRAREEIRQIADGVRFVGLKDNHLLETWTREARAITGSVEPYGFALSTFLHSIQLAYHLPMRAELDLPTITHDLFSTTDPDEWDKAYRVVSNQYGHIFVNRTQYNFSRAVGVYIEQSADHLIDLGTQNNGFTPPDFQLRRNLALGTVLTAFDIQSGLSQPPNWDDATTQYRK